jgi:regulator of protease activity HflC (stomatin/prohibitin superfamily)
MTDAVILILLGLAVVIVLVLSNLRIVPQSKAVVMERLGVYSRTWHTGLHIKLPFVERPAKIVDLKEQVYAQDCQRVITKENVDMAIDSVVFYQVSDCKLFVYGHANPIEAISHITATTLRNLVGELELDELLTSRSVINAKMRTILDEATDAWGIRITRVELKNIHIFDQDLRDAMEKQMIAERKRREAIITAEGERKSSILKAEGIKQALILEAEGKAEAIRLVNEAEPSKEYLTIKSLEAFEKAADGQATKIIIPSEIQGLAGLTKSAAEIFKTNPAGQADLEVEVK